MSEVRALRALRALLLTDVVDSTLLSARLGDAAMAQLWAAHDRIARDLLPTWRGREIDKTDGMLLLFDSAADAAGYARAYHLGLAASLLPLKARAGLHVGPVLLRQNSAADVARGAKPLEVEGLAKPTAARVMALASGGQTLLTSEANAALQASGLQTRPQGHWLMKGLAEPLGLFALDEAGEPSAAPQDSEKAYRVVRSGERWLPAREIPNNLPLQSTSFVGRDHELDEVKTYLRGTRLLTLQGMGGLGKTRLCLQAAAELMAEFADGAWFVDLAPLRDPALVLSETAQVLGVREELGRTPLQTLCEHLRPRRVLLILDNCEHLVQAVAELAHAVLRVAPQVHILATSREALRVPGEQSCPVLPLALPRQSADLEAMRQSPAVRLFVERARLHRPAFALDATEAPAVAELVRRLEGIPLALELAAARVRSMTVADIHSRLNDRFKILTGGDRGLQHRQRTLRALIDWSYGLLTEPERCFVRRLGVFVGGFDLAAAEFVCSGDAIAADDVMDLLRSLVDKSLLTLDDQDQGSRYRMLETIRDYVHELLQAGGEEVAVQRRHASHFSRVAEDNGGPLVKLRDAGQRRRLLVDQDNLRAALAWMTVNDPRLALRSAAVLAPFWRERGHHTEGRQRGRELLDHPELQAPAEDRATLLSMLCGLANERGEASTLRSLAQALLREGRALGDRKVEAQGHVWLAHAAGSDDDIESAYNEFGLALTLMREVGEPARIAEALTNLACTAIDLGRVAEAWPLLDEAQPLFEQLQSAWGLAFVAQTRAEAACAMGDFAAALAPATHGVALTRTLGHQHRIAATLQTRAALLCRLGRPDEAMADLGEALALSLKHGFKPFTLRGLSLLACMAAGAGRVELAATLMAVVQGMIDSGARWTNRSERAEHQQAVVQVRATLDAAAWHAAWERGSALDAEAAVALCLNAL